MIFEKYLIPDEMVDRFECVTPEHLLSLGVEHTYAESPGNHSWPYWDEQIQKTLRLFLGKNKA